MQNTGWVTTLINYLEALAVDEARDFGHVVVGQIGVLRVVLAEESCVPVVAIGKVRHRQHGLLGIRQRGHTCGIERAADGHGCCPVWCRRPRPAFVLVKIEDTAAENETDEKSDD